MSDHQRCERLKMEAEGRFQGYTDSMREFRRMGNDKPLDEDSNGNVTLQQEDRLRQMFNVGSSYLNNIHTHSLSEREQVRRQPAPSDWPYRANDWSSGGSVCRDTRRDWTMGQLPAGLPTLDRLPNGQLELPSIKPYIGKDDELWSRDAEGSPFGYGDVAPWPQRTWRALTPAELATLWGMAEHVSSGLAPNNKRGISDRRRRDSVAACSADFGSVPGLQDVPAPPPSEVHRRFPSAD